MSESGTETALAKAVWHLLRPLVRLLVRNGMTYPRLTPMLKTLYLEAAEAELGRDASGSRVHLATGLHRKDIRRMRTEGSEHPAPRPLALGARLVAEWIARPDTTDSEGKPLPLPLRADTGVSLEALITQVSTDVRPRAVLEEWQRLGVIETDDEGRAVLRESAFVPTHGDDEKAHYFGRNLHDHIAAGARNLSGDEPPLLERSVYYNRLSDRSVEELSALSKELGQESLERINRRARDLQRRDVDRGDTGRRMHFGVYFYEADDEGGPEDG